MKYSLFRALIGPIQLFGLILLGAAIPVKGYPAPSVVVSIAPIHSLVAGVMDGVGAPSLMMPPGQSPHIQPLSPSAIRSVHSADLLIWAGAEFEVSLAKIISQVDDAQSLELTRLDSLAILPARAGGSWEEGLGLTHGHHDDPHFWLSTGNARVIVNAVADLLVEIDPENGQTYLSNRDTLHERIEMLHTDLVLILEPVSGLPYLVFHDAYQYFEQEFGLSPSGAISVGPDRMPGAKRIRELRQLVSDKDVRCIFTEPQFEPRLVQTIVEGTDVGIGQLDPLGAGLDPGPQQWFVLLSSLANNLRDCLTEG